MLDIGARVMVAGADYILLAPYDTFIRSTKPVSDRATICHACMALEISLHLYRPFRFLSKEKALDLAGACKAQPGR